MRIYYKMGRNILFYSNRCKLCESFLIELSQTKFKNDFQYICVDPGPNNQRPKLPGFLKKVPTMLLDGNSNEPLEGAEAMNWLWVAKMQTGDSGGNTVPTNNPASAPNDGGMGLSFWNPLEMGGGSDTYSFLDQDTSVEGNGGFSISQNYEYIGGGPGFGAGAGGGGGRVTAAAPQVKKSAKEQQFDSEMERYQQMRNMGVPQPVNRR